MYAYLCAYRCVIVVVFCYDLPMRTIFWNLYMNCSEYWDMMYSRGISWSYMICARVCIMYYVLCIDSLYILTVFYLIMYDYVYTVCVCLSVLCLECIVILYQTVAFWNVYIVKKWMWRCVRFPFILQPQGGRCQVWLVPRVVAHLSGQALAVRPASIFSMQRVAEVLPRLPVCSSVTSGL